MYNNLLTENNYHCIKVISKRIRHYLKNQVNNLKINKSKGNTAIRFPLLYPTLDFCVLAKLEKKISKLHKKVCGISDINSPKKRFLKCPLSFFTGLKVHQFIQTLQVNIYKQACSYSVLI